MSPRTLSLGVVRRELKRRKVVRACIVYLLACWGGLKSADVILTFLKFDPDLASHTVVAAAIIGLPITAVLSWFYNVSLSGITRHPPFVERRVLNNIALLEDRRKGASARGVQPRPESAYDWVLEFESGPLSGQRYGLEGSVVIGRSSECDLTIPVPRISRQHARFTVDGNKLLLEDLNSSNGTSVNGSKLKSKMTLNHLDKIELLEVIIRVKESEAHFHAQDSTQLHDAAQQRRTESLGSIADT